MHRMGNLYAWGERVVRAAREAGAGESGVEEGVEEVWEVVMAARDLVAWLLCEEAKEEVWDVWRAWCGEREGGRGE